MELLIKTYIDKPSRIGIKYPYEWLAVKPYEELMKKHKGETFIARLEPRPQKINLILRSELSGEKIIYKDLDYNVKQLQNLEHNLNYKTPFQFVHIYSSDNTMLIAKPFKREDFLLVSSYEIVMP